MITLGTLINTIIPPRCLQCRQVVMEDHSLCPACFKLLVFIDGYNCRSCGLPLGRAGEHIGGFRCGSCILNPPNFSQTRVPFLYDQYSRKLILSLKYADRTDLTNLIAGLMLKTLDDVLPSIDLIVPVPLHWQRLFRRTYNQAGLIAEKIAQKTGKKLLLSGLKRLTATPPQGKMTAKQRRKNVSKVFTVPANRHSLIIDRSVLLIDDVMTTGATVSACTKALLQASARQVIVCVFARA